MTSYYADTIFQLLNFFKMSFQLFSVCSIFAIAILMPLNLKVSRSSLLTYPTYTSLEQY